MKTRLLSILLVCLCTAGTTSFAQKKLKLWADAAAFRFDDNRSYVEMYYAFSRSSLAYSVTDGEFRGSALMTAVFRPAATETAPVSKVWRVPVSMKDTAGVASKMLIGKVAFAVPPGKYTLTMTARDEAVAAVSDTAEFPYEIRAFSLRNTRFSDIELCSSIQKIEADSSNIFYKNTLEVIPNPPLLYGKSFPVVMYYTELYGSDLDASILKAEIVSAYGSTVQSKTHRKSGTYASRVEVGTMNVGNIASGVYTLILSHGDTTGIMKTSQSKRFYIFNPDVALDTVQAQRTAASIALEFATMSEDELDTQFSMAIYIANGDERAMWKSISGAEAKKKFLTKFWTDRDSDPATQQNEYFIEYMKRVQYCTGQFRTSYRPGWKTDRGRVYITYGAPDYIQRNTMESDTKAYETWTYDNIQSGAVCVFIDKGGFNELQLVHSTLRNEMSNPEWQQQVKTR